MSFLNKLYPYLPVWIQNIGISMYGYRWKKRRFGGAFNSYYKAYKLRETYTEADWKVFVNIELQKLLNHALHHVPYYQNLFTQIGVTTEDIKTFTTNDLIKIPFLEKNELRMYGESTLLATTLEPKGEFYASSGSTGTPTKILFSESMHQKWSAAFECRIRNWANLSINDARGMIGGRRVVPNGHNKGPFYRYNFGERQIYFSAYHISALNTPDYIYAINKYKPAYMTGYAMSNYILAQFIEQSGLRAPKLKAVITSSEKLTQEMRETFRRVYDCKTYDSYSGVEACSLVSECEFGKLHASPDVGHIEFIKDDGTYAQPGELGEMVCTGFLNYDQPLIRYRIGDIAKLSINQTCECKRNMPIVEEIVGRTEDVVTGADGRKMVRFHGIFIDIPSIIEGQIIQHTNTTFEIKVVLSKPLTNEDKQRMHQRLESQIGQIELSINSVDSIPRTPSGKFKAVISHVKN
jgi:phenylacetate-CoA ligase